MPPLRPVEFAELVPRRLVEAVVDLGGAVRGALYKRPSDNDLRADIPMPSSPLQRESLVVNRRVLEVDFLTMFLGGRSTTTTVHKPLGDRRLVTCLVLLSSNGSIHT